MLAVLLITAAAAQPSDWYAAPVVSSLQPVRDPFLYRWQDNVSAVMSGRTASPLFRASAAQMDAYWRLAAVDTERPWISDQDAQLAMEHAGLGALLALQLSIDQIISRSPEISTIQRSLRTLAGPSMVIEKKQEGVQVQLNERPRSQRVAMASLQEPLRGRRPSPQVRVSSGLRIVEDTRGNPAGEDYTILRPGLSLTAGAEHLGPVNLQLRTALLQERTNQTTIDWRAAVRLRALPRVSLLGDIQGDEQLVARLQTGVEWRLPVAPLVTSRIIGSHRVADGEQRVMLQLNRPLQWHIPSDIQRWPLGEVLYADGPSPIRRIEVGPGPLVRLVPERVARDALARQRGEAAEDARSTATDAGS